MKTKTLTFASGFGILAGVCMPVEITGGLAHEVLGLGLVGVALAHSAKNAWWFKGGVIELVRSGKKMSPLMTALLIVSMLTVLVTGMLTSRFAFSALRVQTGLSTVMMLHLASAYWMILLAGAHLGMHQAFGMRRFSVRGLWIRTIWTLLAALGIYVALDMRLIEILAVRSLYTTVDIEAGLFAIVIDHIALIAATAYFTSLVRFAFGRILKLVRNVRTPALRSATAN